MTILKRLLCANLIKFQIAIICSCSLIDSKPDEYKFFDMCDNITSVELVNHNQGVYNVYKTLPLEKGKALLEEIKTIPASRTYIEPCKAIDDVIKITYDDNTIEFVGCNWGHYQNSGEDFIHVIRRKLQNENYLDLFNKYLDNKVSCQAYN